jgi:hypothetical protein
MYGITELTPVWLILAATASLILVYAFKRREWKTRKGSGHEAAGVRGTVNEHISEEPEAQQSGKGSEGFEEVTTKGQNGLAEVIQSPQPSQGEMDSPKNQSELQSGQVPVSMIARVPDVPEDIPAAVNVGTKEEKSDAVAMHSKPAAEPKAPEPVKHGGKPRGPTVTSRKPPMQQAEVVRLKPEIVCWNSEWQWTAAVEVAEELLGGSGLMVLHNGSSLAQDGSRDNCWPLHQMNGQVLVQWNEHSVPVILGEENYLLFKLSGQNHNQGRRVKFASHGSYLVITPDDWERDQSLSGPPPIAPEPTSLPGYRAHFFYLERNGKSKIAFCAPEGRHIEVESTRPNFEFVGMPLSDASDGKGPLFGESPPKIRVHEDRAWKNVSTIVIGAEGAGRGRWRKEFTPDPERTEQNLPPEIGARRGGWYFLRFYNLNYELVDSLDFRFVSALTEISMPPPQSLPSENGHQPVTVKFHHTNDCIVRPTADHASALVVEHGATCTAVTIPPDPAFDQTYWEVIFSSADPVEIQLLVDRIWWSQSDDCSPPFEAKKFDRPLHFKRDDFRATSNTVLHLWLPKPRWVDEVLFGFREDSRHTYKVQCNSRYVSIPLRDFADAAELGDRSQNATLRFWLVRDGIPEAGAVISEVLAEVAAAEMQANQPIIKPDEMESTQMQCCSNCDHARRSYSQGAAMVSCRRHIWDRVSTKTFNQTQAHWRCDEWRGEYQDAQGTWHIK